PHILGLAGLLLALVLTLLAAGAVMRGHVNQELDRAEKALADGQQYLSDREYAKAADSFAQGLTVARNTPGGGDLAATLEERLRLAQRARTADELYALAERLRF